MDSDVHPFDQGEPIWRRKWTAARRSQQQRKV